MYGIVCTFCLCQWRLVCAVLAVALNHEPLGLASVAQWRLVCAVLAVALNHEPLGLASVAAKDGTI